MAIAVGMAYRLANPPSSVVTKPVFVRKSTALLERFRLLEDGMTIKQIEAILGPPTWTGRMMDEYGACWEDDEKNTYAVLFFEDGTVYYKNWCPRREVGETADSK
jgi:hypothetical protein